MKLLFYAILFLIVLVFGVSFAAKNPQFVEVNYYFDFHREIALSILLFIVLAIGALLGVLLTLTWVFRAKRQASKAKRNLRKMEEEVANLRAIPIKDTV